MGLNELTTCEIMRDLQTIIDSDEPPFIRALVCKKAIERLEKQEKETEKLRQCTKLSRQLLVKSIFIKDFFTPQGQALIEALKETMEQLKESGSI